MALFSMQSAVVYTGILIALRFILDHESGRIAAEEVLDNPAWQNMTRVFNTTTNKNLTDFRDTPDRNRTWSNEATSLDCDNCGDAWSFYLSWLPKYLLAYVVMIPLQYHWNMWLERCFPARPRDVEVAQHTRPEKVLGGDGDDELEEEVVKRWIAKGRIQRSSISWRNTLLKWLLDIAVGKIMCKVVVNLAVETITKGPAMALGEYKKYILVSWFRCTFSIGPLASLIGFVVIPAEGRVTFGAGADLVEAIFISAFLRVVVPWVVNTEIVQGALKTFTEGMLEYERSSSKEQHLIDEL
ncbi:hypothetical protein GQ53DRAFT_763984 [Thozetella sp. PMI_491]|nr:hypothetical protein GQ53DRAFT_763984 [Thozetella sp. PMI_491]